MAVRTIILARHGQYSKPDLNAVGRRQARHLARRLAETRATAIHCSTLPRAAQTAEIVSRRFPRLQVRRSHLLRECIPVIPSASPGLAARIPRGALKLSRDRADRAYLRYFKPTRGSDKLDIIVCHGNMIRYFVTRALGLKTARWGHLGTSHCGITTIRIKPDGAAILVAYNETGHLPESLRST